MTPNTQIRLLSRASIQWRMTLEIHISRWVKIKNWKIWSKRIVQNQNVSLMKVYNHRLLKRNQNPFILMQIVSTQSKSAKLTRIANNSWLLTVQRRSIAGAPWRFVMSTVDRKIDGELYVICVGFVRVIITLTFVVNARMILSTLSDDFGCCHYSSLCLYSVFFSAYSM